MLKKKLLLFLLLITSISGFSQTITPQWKPVTGGLMSYFYPAKSPAGYDTLWNAQKIRSYVNNGVNPFTLAIKRYADSLHNQIIVGNNVYSGSNVHMGLDTFAREITLGDGISNYAQLGTSSFTFGINGAQTTAYGSTGITDVPTGRQWITFADPMIFTTQDYFSFRSNAGSTQVFYLGAPADDQYNWLRYRTQIGGTRDVSNMGTGEFLKIYGKAVVTGGATNPDDVVTLKVLTGGTIPSLPTKDSIIVTLSDTTSLKSYAGLSVNAFVTDTTGTGGNFKYVSNITKNDGGKYFPATGKGSGTWVRDAPRKYYNLAWYGFDRTGVRNDSLKFANLVTSIDSGSTVYAQTGRYNFNIKLSKSIHLIGEKQPLYNGSRLIDGTIILGFIDFVNHFGASVSTLGIDQHAANPFFTNGLMNNSSDQGTVTTRELQQKISNITLLGRGYLAADAFKTSQHAIYISSGKHIDLENISIFRYNQGIAVKAPYTNVTNVHGEDNNTDLIIVKADDLHLDVGGVNVTNVTGIADTAGTAVSVYAQASAGGNLHDVNFTAINLTATASADAGFYAQGLNTGTKMSGINFTNVTSTGSNVTGFYASQSSGAIVKDVNFTNAIATNSTGSAFKVLSANYINFNNAHAINSGNYSFENQGGTNIQVNSGVSTTPVAGDYSGTFIKNSINDFQYIGGKLKVGGGNTAEAKLHVDENTVVGANAGDSQILTSFWSKPGTNVFQERNWLIRKVAGANYTGVAVHNGFGIDATASTPTTDRVWIERHPFNQTIAFGSIATTFLTLSPTSLNTSIPLVLQNGSATGAMTLGADVNGMTNTPSTRHLGRIATLAYDAVSPVNLITGDNNVSTNIIGIGSGTSGYAPTSVQVFAAANNTTLGGTQITNVNTSGFQVLSGAINVTGLTASQLTATDASKNIVSTTALPSGTTATTQAAGTNNTTVATTAFVQSALTLVARTPLLVSANITMALNADYLNTTATQYTLTTPATTGFTTDGSKIITGLATGTGGFKVVCPTGYSIKTPSGTVTPVTGSAIISQNQKFQLIPIGTNSYYLQPLNGTITVS